jgi:hypothetical protein
MYLKKSLMSLMQRIHMCGICLFKFSDEAKNSGRNVYSVNAIFERIRWHTDIETVSDVPFKLSNNHRAYYARKYMNSDPSRNRFFSD